MQDEPVDLDDYLSSRFFDVQSEKLKVYEAVLGAVLRKYVPSNKKIEINLIKAYNDTIMNLTINHDGIAKVSWEEDNVSI